MFFSSLQVDLEELSIFSSCLTPCPTECKSISFTCIKVAHEAISLHASPHSSIGRQRRPRCRRNNQTILDVVRKPGQHRMLLHQVSHPFELCLKVIIFFIVHSQLHFLKFINQLQSQATRQLRTPMSIFHWQFPPGRMFHLQTPFRPGYGTVELVSKQAHGNDRLNVKVLRDHRSPWTDGQGGRASICKGDMDLLVVFLIFPFFQWTKRVSCTTVQQPFFFSLLQSLQPERFHAQHVQLLL